jgi:hypothetical protein
MLVDLVNAASYSAACIPPSVNIKILDGGMQSIGSQLLETPVVGRCCLC